MKRFILIASVLLPIVSRAAIEGHNGLGWDGGGRQEVHDFWIQSAPVAIGVSWRPAYGANVSVELSPAVKEVKLPNGQSWTPYGGQAFVRYSPDKLHWSSWQALERSKDARPNRVFHGQIQVPQVDRERYAGFVSEYSTLNVPWKSDEEAVVKWILVKEPDFFAKQIPFIGYVEFRFEDSLAGGQRIERVKLDLWWGVGGLHSIPKDPTQEKNREGAWRFEAH